MDRTLICKHREWSEMNNKRAERQVCMGGSAGKWGRTRETWEEEREGLPRPPHPRTPA